MSTNKYLLSRTELHRTNTSHVFVDVCSDGDITIHEIYKDSESKFPEDKNGYQVIMSVRGSDVIKLRDLLNEVYVPK